MKGGKHPELKPLCFRPMGRIEILGGGFYSGGLLRICTKRKHTTNQNISKSSKANIVHKRKKNIIRVKIQDPSQPEQIHSRVGSEPLCCWSILPAARKWPMLVMQEPMNTSSTLVFCRGPNRTKANTSFHSLFVRFDLCTNKTPAADGRANEVLKFSYD